MTPMDASAFDSAMDDMSPAHYQEFRRLYNELLGYVERNEQDKITAFMRGLDASLHRSLVLHRTLDLRLRQFQQHRNVVQKEALHQRFRNPQETIEVTHPFPLPHVADDAPMPVDAPERAPSDGPVSTVSDDQRWEDLMAQMTAYNQERSAQDHQVSGMTTDPPNVVGEATQAPDGEASVVQPKLAHDDAPPDDDGTSLRDQFYDPSLYIKKNTSKDVSRASNPTAPASSPKDHEAPASPMTDQERKARIWDYIDKDNQSGGISHDL